MPKRVARSTTLPAPTEGWDTETPVAELPLTRARRLDNWIPKGVSLEMRKGFADHVTGITPAVETLMPYNAGAASTLFAAADDSIYDVTSAGSVGAASLDSLTNARFSYVNFTTSGGSYLWICNGVDNPRHWNGSAWATPALTITTYTDNDINYVFESKERLFLLFKNTLTFGYLPVQSIAGTVDNFPLGAVFSQGGRLIAGGTLTHDGGDGPDDYTVFLTSEGEVAVYRGANPGDADDWALVGNWYAGEPVGDRPLVELDGDLAVITRNGLVPLSQVFAGDSALNPIRYLTGRISTPFRARVNTGVGFDGWEGVFYSAGDILLINLPTSATTAEQYVRHQITGGWTRFTGWDFACFEVFNGRLYAGRFTGGVVLCDDGYDDDGEDIIGAIDTAWTALGSRGVLKRLTAVRPVVTTDSGAAVRMVARTDYRDTPALPGFPSSTLTNALIWGSGIWGTNVWGGVDIGNRQWRSISGVGHTISLILEAESNQSPFALNGIDLVYELGGMM